MITDDQSNLFDREMDKICRETERVLGKRLNRFRAMLAEHKGIKTAQKLLAIPPAEGFTDLALAGRLDLTVEGFIYSHPEWHQVFEKEMPEIKKRLGVKDTQNYLVKLKGDQKEIDSIEDMKKVLASMRGARDSLQDLVGEGTDRTKDRRQIVRLNEAIQIVETFIAKFRAGAIQI